MCYHRKRRKRKETQLITFTLHRDTDRALVGNFVRYNYNLARAIAAYFRVNDGSVKNPSVAHSSGGKKQLRARRKQAHFFFHLLSVNLNEENYTQHTFRTFAQQYKNARLRYLQWYEVEKLYTKRNEECAQRKNSPVTYLGLQESKEAWDKEIQRIIALDDSHTVGAKGNYYTWLKPHMYVRAGESTDPVVRMCTQQRDNATTPAYSFLRYLMLYYINNLTMTTIDTTELRLAFVHMCAHDVDTQELVDILIELCESSVMVDHYALFGLDKPASKYMHIHNISDEQRHTALNTISTVLQSVRSGTPIELALRCANIAEAKPEHAVRFYTSLMSDRMEGYPATSHGLFADFMRFCAHNFSEV